jgi:hypothetical protein
MADGPANDEMVDGFRDGYDLSAPEPSANRSHSYRHGFANGRDDRSGQPRASYAELIRMADLAMEMDRNIQGCRKMSTDKT